MKRSGLGLLILTLLSVAIPAKADSFVTTGDHSHTLQAGPFKPTRWKTANIASKIDGANIHVAWTQPNTTERVPIILDASPYLGTSVEHSETMVPFLRDEYVQHGYAVGGIEVRGTGYSGGCIDMFGPRETADLDQAITWLASQPWSNGNVALIGSSYEGSTPYGAASTGNPHLKGIVAMNGIPALHDLMFRDGVAHSANGPAIVATYNAEGSLRYVTSGVRPTVPGCQSMATGVVASEQAVATKGGGNLANYWSERDYRTRILKNYKGAAFIVMGLEDWNVDPHVAIPFAQRMADAGIDVRQLYHHGGHWWPDLVAQGPDTMRWDWAQILLEWFEQHLKGGPAPTHGHRVEVQSANGDWVGLDSFPPKDAYRLDLHLRAHALRPRVGLKGSQLLTAQGWNGDRFTDINGPMPVLPGSSYVADTPFPNVATVSGLVKLDATVVPLGPGGDVTAWLYDVAPDGTESRLTWSQMNLAFADGTTTRRSVAPGRPLTAHLTFEPTQFVIESGHRLRLRVWQYSAAEYLPGTIATPLRLLYGPGQDSVLRLPILASPRTFVPPATAAKPRVETKAYRRAAAPPAIDASKASATFTEKPGDKQARIVVTDVKAPASASFHVCEDANSDGTCGGTGELSKWSCYEATVPLSGRGKLVVTVYAASQFVPAGSTGACSAPTAFATLNGSVQATVYA